MITVESKLRKWGRSFGVVIPKEMIIKENLIEGEDLHILLTKKGNPIIETFGVFKFKRPVKEILDEGNKECWDE